MQIMNTALDQESKQVLWACLESVRQQPEALGNHELCYRWIVGRYKAKFGEAFHQVKLGQLADQGFLKRSDTTRGGNRRYYEIANPSMLTASLRQWNLN